MRHKMLQNEKTTKMAAKETADSNNTVQALEKHMREVRHQMAGQSNEIAKYQHIVKQVRNESDAMTH